MITLCQSCNECKPCFYSLEPTKLIEVTQPMEQLNLDFKGPLPSNSNNKYVLIFVDEYSHFPLAIPYQDVKAISIYKAYVRFFPFLEYLHMFIQIGVLLL